MKIAFFDTKEYDKKSFDNINKNFRYSIKYFKERLNLDTVILAKGFEVICAFVNDDIDKNVIEKLYSFGIKLIVLRCAGYNNVDLSSSFRKIHILRVPAYSPYAVAEHTTGLILSLNRKIHKAYYRTKDNNFSINGFLGFDMHGKTVGVIGTGKIAKIFINILNGFGMNVLANDPFPNEEYAKNNNFKYVDLDNLYKNSDIISLHCPLTKDTKYIINKSTIEKMKKNVMIINTSRGPLINTKDLIAALKQHKIGSAGLDVYEEESEYFFENFSEKNIDDDTLARLLTFNNVLITSHQAFFTKEALEKIAETTLQNIDDFFQGNPTPNEICYNCGEDNKNCTKVQTGKCF